MYPFFNLREQSFKYTFQGCRVMEESLSTRITSSFIETAVNEAVRKGVAKLNHLHFDLRLFY